MVCECLTSEPRSGLTLYQGRWHILTTYTHYITLQYMKSYLQYPLVWPWLSLANQNCDYFLKPREIEIAIFCLWGRFFSMIFNAFYKQSLNCVFGVYAIHTAQILLCNSDICCIWTKKTYIMCFSDQILLLLPPLSQQRFLFTNERSASRTVVLCSDQKFINVSHEKSTVKSRLRFFFKNWIKIDGK